MVDERPTPSLGAQLGVFVLFIVLVTVAASGGLNAAIWRLN